LQEPCKLRKPGEVLGETEVLTLFLMLLLTALALAVFLYVGSLFLQGTYYTQPSETLFWGAPAAGLALALFLLLWCLLIVKSPGASPENIPYNTGFAFNPRVDILKEAVKELRAVKKNGEEVLYKRHRVHVGMKEPRDVYKTDQDAPLPWRGQGVEKIILDVEGEKHVFKLVLPPEGERRERRYREFVCDQGWIIKEMDDGPTGRPEAYRWGRFLANLCLNLVHLGLWFVCLWVLLRFQWSHALGLGFCLWLVFTFAFLPMLLSYAARVAARSSLPG
jgi:hypothetical protein